MCGIIGYLNINKNKEKVGQEVLEQYQDQRTRGTEGFGLISINPQKKVKTSRATNEVPLIMHLTELSNERIQIMHHRKPTSTDNKIKQTHPIEVNNENLKYKYLVVHNGMISNADEMRDIHENEGFIYTTLHVQKDRTYNTIKKEVKFNDSETIAIELTQLIEGKIKKLRTTGGYACIIVQINKKTNTAKEIYFARNSTNPLKLAKSRDIIKIASEGPGNDTKPDTLYHFNLTNFSIYKKEIKTEEKETSLDRTDTTGQTHAESRITTLNDDTPDDKENAQDTKEDKTEDTEEEIDTLEEKINEKFEELKDEIDEIIEDTCDAVTTSKEEEIDIGETIYTSVRQTIKNKEQEIKEEQEKYLIAHADQKEKNYSEVK